MKKLAWIFLCMAPLWADGKGVIESQRSNREVPLTADPQAKHWKGVAPAIIENGPLGDPVPNHRSEVRSLWTDKNLYILFTCPYEELNLKPDPDTTKDTWRLWEWDVAEVFVGAEMDKIWHYREYQVSPQGEWVDLDIDRKNPLPQGGMLWNSGYKVKARIDNDKKIWYGEFQIPIESINGATAKSGAEMRINFYRIQGKKPNGYRMLAWQPTGARNYHVPESFGRLKLVGK
jgi:hypothetical protein